MIRVIFFDLGQVIVPFDLNRGYAALAPHCPHSPEEIRRRIAGADLVRPFEEGRIRPEQFMAELSSLLDLRVDERQFCELWSSIFLPETLVPESLIEGLARRYRLLLLSNTNAIHYRMIRERYPLMRHFHDGVLSFEVGALKPDDRIYEEALRRAGCAARECFYTDDIPEYVEAGRRHGMDAVRFECAEQLVRELAARGVEW